MSTPTLTEFNPSLIPWQMEATNFISEFDYSQGVLEVLFSGSVGSAKSIEAAHLTCLHAIENAQSRVLAIRRALKDLKRTFWPTVLKHLADVPHLIKSYNKTEMKITLVNGSEIIGDSYDDMNLEKFRSLELSMVIIEEATESNKEVYEAIKMRVGRLPKVPKNIILCLTNPDAPDHYLYEYFIANEGPCRKVFYSLTHQNPFLPSWYVENLRRDLDPKMALRMLEGQWIEINQERIYYAYSSEYNFINETYKFNPAYPVCLMHDFNRAAGKPMSAAVGQEIKGNFHVAKTFLVDGGRTQDVMDEIADAGYLDLNTTIKIYGDASGKHTDTRNNRSDWDIISEFINNYKRADSERNTLINNVPLSNPTIRGRHNVLNALFRNDLGETHLFIYKEARDADKGFKLTKLKKGAELVEDDSLREQHVTTAIGYWAHKSKNTTTPQPIRITR
jgi:hypothetical protein